jgi:glycosyltransferase involved in cell wall biosynthesis
MSYVLLESLAHGVPVIATENTGAMDIISDNKEGFVVPIREPDAIAERIVHLYKNRDILEKMSKNALLKAKTQFTWEKYGDRIVGIYEKLINHK